MIIMHYTSSRAMYELSYEYLVETYDAGEQEAYELDEDYARDTHDLDELAYRHYA